MRAGIVPLMGLCVALLGACSDSTSVGAEPGEQLWPDEQEVVYQTRELFNYLDEQHRLELERLHTLGVPPAQTGQSDAEQQQAQHPGIAPAHEGG